MDAKFKAVAMTRVTAERAMAAAMMWIMVRVMHDVMAIALATIVVMAAKLATMARAIDMAVVQSTVTDFAMVVVMTRTTAAKFKAVAMAMATAAQAIHLGHDRGDGCSHSCAKGNGC